MNLSKRTQWILSLIIVAGIGMAAKSLFRPGLPTPVAPPLLSLEKMGQLVSVKINYSDVIEFAEKSAIDLPFNREIRLGSTKALLVAKGDCTIATDLTNAKYENVDPEKRALTVVLTAPHALSVRINHDGRDKGGSYFYAMTENGITAFIDDPGKRTKAVDNALAKAQAELKHVCLSAPNVASAKQNAEAVLRSMYVATGWTPTFTWTQPTAPQ